MLAALATFEYFGAFFGAFLNLTEGRGTRYHGTDNGLAYSP